MDLQDRKLFGDIKRSLDLLLRLKIQEIKGDRTQKDLILLMDSLGCRPSEIAELLGTKTATVNPILSRSRRR